MKTEPSQASHGLVYKIISPGGEQYGVYIIKDAVTDDKYAISYILQPSDDRYGCVALHDLIFHGKAGIIGQQAHISSDQNIHKWEDTFLLEKNHEADPRPIEWSVFPAQRR